MSPLHLARRQICFILSGFYFITASELWLGPQAGCVVLILKHFLYFWLGSSRLSIECPGCSVGVYTENPKNPSYPSTAGPQVSRHLWAPSGLLVTLSDSHVGIRSPAIGQSPHLSIWNPSHGPWLEGGTGRKLGSAVLTSCLWLPDAGAARLRGQV